MSIFNTIKKIGFADGGTALLQSMLVPPYSYSAFTRNNALTAVYSTRSLRFIPPAY